MASLPPSLNKTLAYFDKYDYPLTKEELKYWTSSVSPSSIPPLKLRGGKKRGVIFKNGFYFLSNRQNLVKLRKQREKFSRPKWIIAKKVGEQLKQFPTIVAVFVTGALAMNNCPANDDIDLMIVTSPHTLWITRFFVVIYLKFLGIRRHPSTINHELTANNQICDNLWLDSNHLSIKHNHSLYTAHEILQAKVLWDRSGIYQQFLTQNSWVKKYLPNAYLSLLKLPSPNLGEGPRVRYWVLWPLNLLFFLIQYLYMLSKMTSEKVGLGFAFFHPSKLAFPHSS